MVFHHCVLTTLTQQQYQRKQVKYGVVKYRLKRHEYCTPFRFSANRFAAGAVSSMEISGTGTGDDEINAPLKGKGASTTFNNGVTINGALVVGTTNVMNVRNNTENRLVFLHV